MYDKKLTLVEHLEELRGSIIRSIISVAIASTAVYAFVDKILPGLVKPVGRLVFIAPQEAFISRIKIAFFAGILLSGPFILFQIWGFIFSGLSKSESKYVLFFAPLSVLFFFIGASFGYFIIVPIGIKFLLGFASQLMAPMITVSKYISFVGLLTICFGILFEMPLVSLFLTKIGLVTPEFLSAKRKQSIVIIFIVSAALTPPDIITQCLMAIPLIALYEISIIFSKMLKGSKVSKSKK
ncbi:MAG: twin-arginine translocase subunit TatC [Candidatus Omnitrophica bacterium]|nr:twin-arginine translocase subunit TatC [Candidatus Omnitrophota bacterium]